MAPILNDNASVLSRNFIEVDKCPMSSKYCGTELYKQGKNDGNVRKLERAVDGAPSQILTLKFLTPPAPHSPTPKYDLGNRMNILFNMFSIFYL